MIKTKCLDCGNDLTIDSVKEGEGYFFGYDTDYYGCGIGEERDPHEIVGYYCKECGEKLRRKAEAIGWKPID